MKSENGQGRVNKQGGESEKGDQWSSLGAVELGRLQKEQLNNVVLLRPVQSDWRQRNYLTLWREQRTTGKVAFVTVNIFIQKE